MKKIEEKINFLTGTKLKSNFLIYKNEENPYICT